MRALLLSLFLSLSSPADAGSICNDGTYSYSEGRGTCSWHGGVATSGVYLDSQQSNSYRDQVGSNQRWVDSYDVNDDGDPYHDTIFVTPSGIFNYTCYVLKDRTIVESIALGFLIEIKDNIDLFAVSKDFVKVFAHSRDGISLISGNWSLKVGSGSLIIAKGSSSHLFPSDPLTSIDMSKILHADKFIISIKGISDTEISMSGAFNKISSTWGKCDVSKKASK